MLKNIGLVWCVEDIKLNYAPVDASLKPKTTLNLKGEQAAMVMKKKSEWKK